MKCRNHPAENAWYYIVEKATDDRPEVKTLLCLACSEAAVDLGFMESLYEIPYGVEHSLRRQ